MCPSSPSRRTKTALLIAASLGWFFGGMQILLTNLGMRAASLDLMDRVGMLDLALFTEFIRRTLIFWIRSWHSSMHGTPWSLNGMHGFNAPSFWGGYGGLPVWKTRDRYGRTKMLGISIVVFSGFTGLAWFAQSPLQLLCVRFLACLGWEGHGRTGLPWSPKSGVTRHGRFWGALLVWQGIWVFSPCPHLQLCMMSLLDPGVGCFWSTPLRFCLVGLSCCFCPNQQGGSSSLNRREAPIASSVCVSRESSQACIDWNRPGDGATHRWMGGVPIG